MSPEELKAQETQLGRWRQAGVTVILAFLLVAAMWLYLHYNKDSQQDGLFSWLTGGMCVLALNYISKNVLMELVRRMPLPKKLTGE